MCWCALQCAGLTQLPLATPPMVNQLPRVMTLHCLDITVWLLGNQESHPSFVVKKTKKNKIYVTQGASQHSISKKKPGTKQVI